MFSFKAKVQYKGTGFYGWQTQGSDDYPTIQRELERAIKQVTKSSHVKVLGASRTDRGVHALHQICRIDLPHDIPRESFLKALNKVLHNQVRIASLENCRNDFHPIFHCVEKTYFYLLSRDKGNPFNNNFFYHLPFDLDWSLFEKGAKLFEGTHDFQNFYCEGSDIKTTQRTIYECELVEDLEEIREFIVLPSETYALKIRGSGFLKQMVRLIVGALIKVGTSKASLEEISRFLEVKQGTKLGAVVPPQGLFLTDIKYNKS